MLVIVVMMLVSVMLALLVVVYVAYPHRGEDLPAAPWLGEAMAKAADAAPIIEPEDEIGYSLLPRKEPVNGTGASPAGDAST